MNDQDKLKLANKAIGHALRTIITDPRKWWYLGYGTETYSLLTEAYAALNEDSVSRVRDNCLPDKRAFKCYKDAREKLEKMGEQDQAMHELVREAL